MSRRLGSLVVAAVALVACRDEMHATPANSRSSRR